MQQHRVVSIRSVNASRSGDADFDPFDSHPRLKKGNHARQNTVEALKCLRSTALGYQIITTRLNETAATRHTHFTRWGNQQQSNAAYRSWKDGPFAVTHEEQVTHELVHDICGKAIPD
jgi:beta-lactamase class D